MSSLLIYIYTYIYIYIYIHIPCIYDIEKSFYNSRRMRPIILLEDSIMVDWFYWLEKWIIFWFSVTLQLFTLFLFRLALFWNIAEYAFKLAHGKKRC